MGVGAWYDARMADVDLSRLAADEEDLVDLSDPLRPKRFKLSDQLSLVGPPELSLDAIARMSDLSAAWPETTDIQSSEQLKAAINTLWEALTAVFGREQVDMARPKVGLTMLRRLITATLETYGERPTPPSLASSGGSANDGTGSDSTGGVPPTT